jgi:hypothetical protein
MIEFAPQRYQIRRIGVPIEKKNFIILEQRQRQRLDLVPAPGGSGN